MEYPRFTISSDGQLHTIVRTQSSGYPPTYQVNTKAPKLKSQLLGLSDKFAVTTDHQLYDLYNNRIVELSDSSIKVDRILNNTRHGIPLQYNKYTIAIFVDHKNTLYRAEEDINEGIFNLIPIARNVTQCSAIEGLVIGYSKRLGLFVSEIKPYKKPIRVQYEGNGIDKIISDYVIIGGVLHQLHYKDDVYYLSQVSSNAILISDIIPYYHPECDCHEDTVRAGALAISGGKLLNIHGSEIRRVQNPILQEIEEKTSWSKLVVLNTTTIGVISDQFSLYALNGSYLNKLLIDKNLIGYT